LAPLGQSSDSYRKAGALGARLAVLHRRGLALPTTWVLDADPCRDFIEAHLPAGHDLATLLRLSRGRERLARAARARELLAEGEAEPALRSAFEGLCRALAPEAPRGLVLRQSATTEDETVASMAQLGGQARGGGGGPALPRAGRALSARPRRSRGRRSRRGRCSTCPARSRTWPSAARATCRWRWWCSRSSRRG
jgi:hypothetical protein